MGRIPDEDRSEKITIQHLKPHHRAMVRYAAAGKKPGDIAAIFGMSVSQVSIVMNSPLFLVELNRLIDCMEISIPDAAADLQALLGRACEVLGEELYGGEQGSRLRSKVAFEVLDRTGHGKQGDTQIGDRIINIYSNTPKPGDNPEETEREMKVLREEVIEIEEGGNGDSETVGGSSSATDQDRHGDSG